MTISSRRCLAVVESVSSLKEMEGSSRRAPGDLENMREGAGRGGNCENDLSCTVLCSQQIEATVTVQYGAVNCTSRDPLDVCSES